MVLEETEAAQGSAVAPELFPVATPGSLRASLESVVATLRARPSHPPEPPDAAGVVARLAGGLLAHDTRFLDDYLLVLLSNSNQRLMAVTDELMRSVNFKLDEADDRGFGVVLAAWLAAATVWRAPRVPDAACTLLRVVSHFTQPQIEEVARALHGALSARELMVASDALRDSASRGAGAAQWLLAGEGGLAALLLRGALARLLDTAPHWPAGALAVQELCAVLPPRWNTLDTEAQLTGAALAARVVGGAAARGAEASAGAAWGAGGPGGGGAECLLAAFAHPPPPALRHHPDYLKCTVALSRLKKLFDEVYCRCTPRPSQRIGPYFTPIPYGHRRVISANPATDDDE